jgi:hypothetical protein
MARKVVMETVVALPVKVFFDEKTGKYTTKCGEVELKLPTGTQIRLTFPDAS